MEKSGIGKGRMAKVMAAEALTMVGFTTLYDHRELTHHSLKAKKVMNLAGRMSAMMLGRIPRHWARTHISHHAARDANLLNILETADCLDWLNNNSAKTKAKVPHIFKGLDPDAELSPDDVLAIGSSIREVVKDRYDRPTEYSEDDLARLLDGQTPRYYYPKNIKDQSAEKSIKSGDRSINRLRSVLIDPHSPALHRYGVLGVLWQNVPLFKANQRDVKAFEQIGEYDLGQDETDKKFFDNSKLGLSLFFLGNIGLMFMLNKNQSINGRSDKLLNRLAVAAIEGSAVSIGVAQGYKMGGNITNGLGHLGASLYQALVSKPKCKPDGTYPYNAKLFNLVTFDEVGGQYDHHAKPGKIAYTDASGIRKLINAPFGTIVEKLTDRSILYDHGDQYGHPELVEDVFTLDSNRQPRPDEPMRAVLMLEAARRRTMQRAA